MTNIVVWTLISIELFIVSISICAISLPMCSNGCTAQSTAIIDVFIFRNPSSNGFGISLLVSFRCPTVWEITLRLPSKREITLRLPSKRQWSNTLFLCYYLVFLFRDGEANSSLSSIYYFVGREILLASLIPVASTDWKNTLSSPLKATIDHRIMVLCLLLTDGTSQLFHYDRYYHVLSTQIIHTMITN